MNLSGLGIAAIVIGVLTLLIAWIPVIGMLGVPVAAIGLILGVSGIVAARGGQKVGVGVPVAGTLLCVLSIGVSYLTTSSVDLSGRGKGGPPPNTAPGQGKQTEPVNMIGKTGPFKPDLPKEDPRKAFENFRPPTTRP